MSLTARDHPLARRRSRRADELLVLLGDAVGETEAVVALLERAIHEPPGDAVLVQEIHERDDAVNRTTRELLRRLHARFVVPLEPDEVRSLANALSSLSHRASQIVDRLVIFRLDAPREPARRLSHLLVDAVAVVRDAMGRFRAGRRPTDHADRLRDFTRAGDELVRDGLADLYADNPEAPLLVGWSDLYEHFSEVLATVNGIADSFDALNPTA